MNKLVVTVLIIGVAALAAGGGWLLLRDGTPASESSTQTTLNENELTPEKDTQEDEDAVIIAYTDDGFIPSTITAAAGSPIMIMNKSSASLDFASAEHPTHKDNPNLNIGLIAAGESDSFTVGESGEWGFHNHNNSDHSGTLIIE